MSFIDPSEIKRCEKSIVDGKVLAYPTETVWGLGADISCIQAVEKIYELKGRAATKAMSLLVRDVPMAREYAVFDSSIESLMHVFWPGPLTFVLESKKSVPIEIHGGTGFVGLRCSSHPFVRALSEKLLRPITTTSANRVGEKPAKGLTELSWLSPDVTKASWSGRGSDSLKGSTIARFNEGRFEILRDGDLPVQWLKAVASKYKIVSV